MPKNITRALLALGLIPPEFGRRERRLTLVAVVVGLLAVILVLEGAVWARRLLIRNG